MGSIGEVQSSSEARPSIVLGTIQFGRFPGVPIDVLPYATVKGINPMLDTFRSYGHTRIDTARIYGAGFAEQLLGDADYQQRGFTISTKLHPTMSRPLAPHNVPYSHSAEDLFSGLGASLQALKSEYVDTFFLYAPDRSVAWEETLQGLDRLYQSGRFQRWGLCKFPAHEVAEIQQLCIQNGWVRPSVYQGIYNPLLRQVEEELIPCLREYNMSFEAAQPLASGFLTSLYRRDMPDSEHQAFKRFDPNFFLGKHNRSRYWQSAHFDALEIVRDAASSHGLSEIECTMRWLKHHSIIKAELGDGIVIGAADVKQLREVLGDLEKGPLPEGVVACIENAWKAAKLQPYNYHM